MSVPEAWPFKALASSSETLEWFTDNLGGPTTEQRIALRDRPRQTFDYTCRMTADEYARAKPLAKRLAGSEIGCPVWIEGVALGTVASSATSLSFTTTSYGSWDAGRYVLIWQDSETYAAREIATSSGSGITLTAAVGTAFTNAYVYPLRRAIPIEGIRTTRFAGKLADVAVKFLVVDNEDLSSSSALANQYQSLDVMVDPPAQIGDISESVGQSIDYVDNGFGPVVAEPVEDYARQGFTMGFSDEGQAAVWTRRKWFHRLRGRQKPFWMPSFNMDLQLTANIGALTTFVTVESIGPASAYSGRHVMLETLSGTRYFRAVDVVTPGSGTDQISFTSNIGAVVNITDVRRFCFMEKVRLDTDQVTLSYRAPNAATCTVPVVEVPD